MHVANFILVLVLSYVLCYMFKNIYSGCAITVTYRATLTAGGVKFKWHIGLYWSYTNVVKLGRQRVYLGCNHTEKYV